MIKRIYILFFIALFLTNCKSPQFVKTKEISYHTGTAVLWRYNGTYYNQEDKKEYIYFADVFRDRKLMLFNLDGVLEKEIPLNKTIDYYEVTGVVIKDIDTIIVFDHLGQSSHRITYTDREGNCWRKIMLNEIVPIENEDIYGFYYSGFGNSLSDNSFFMRTIWFRYKDRRLYGSTSESKQQYYRKLYTMPCVLSFNLETLTYQFALDTLWRYFCPDTALFIGHTIEITSENNNLFVYTPVSNKLYIMDEESFKVKKIITVDSKYSKIGIDPYPMAKHKMFLEDKLVAGKILKVLYDKYNKMFYVITWHEVSKEEIPFFSERPFSIHIYNWKFKKLGEQYFEGNTYDPRDCMVTQKGLLIKHNENSEKYDPTVMKYDLYELKK